MLLVGSTNAGVGFPEGMELLRSGRAALDVVEAVIRQVESNPADHSVGYGGLPNILGEVELDASIMDGESLATGAVCAVHGYEHPISIAREVMQKLPHVLLAGPGAERFANELGFPRRDLFSPEARAIFEGRSEKGAYPRYDSMRELVLQVSQDPDIAASVEEHHGTVNVIAIDRFGACACTGYGEMAIRAATAHSVVAYLRGGMTLRKACRAAMIDLRRLAVPFPPGMNLVAVDAAGHHAAMTTETERTIDYIFQSEKMREPSIKPRSVVPLNHRVS
jgi:beta-aspartyl-peptidase (threonine type)